VIAVEQITNHQITKSPNDPIIVGYLRRSGKRRSRAPS
jgi:hypothetical protein